MKQTHHDFKPPYSSAVAPKFQTHESASRGILKSAIDAYNGRIALVSSFGAESVVLLHLAAQVDRNLPVIFVDTLMLFSETLAYQKALSEQLGFTNIIHVKPNENDVKRVDPFGALHLTNNDRCCHVRKVEPLERALAPYNALITGRKRYQSANRSKIETVEANPNDRVKVNPLAKWTREDLKAYIDWNELPRHPLVEQGFSSIGCKVCTSKVREGEDERAGRWRGMAKNECGIHFAKPGSIAA